MLWIIPAFWTVNYLAARLAPGIVDPYALAFGRWGMAALCLLAVTGPELWRERAHLARAWWQYLVLGTLGMVICGAWVYIGAQTTTTVNIALIYSAAPVLITVGSVIWLKEAMSGRQTLGVVLAMAGVLHVVLKGHWTSVAGLVFSSGDLWILTATFAWAGYSLLQRAWPSPLGPAARLTAICIGGVAVLVPFTVHEAMQAQALPWTPRVLALMLVTALIPGVGAYGIYGWAQKVLGASRVAVTLYLVPLYTAVVAWLFLGEKPGLHHAVGAALILSGVFLVGAKRPSAVPAAAQT